MRVNVYAEEMTDRIEIIGKEIDGHQFTGLRFYLELPVTLPGRRMTSNNAVARDRELATLAENKFGEITNVSGPFIHRDGDDDSAAVTFWGKHDLRKVLRKALEMLDEHYAPREKGGWGMRDSDVDFVVNQIAQAPPSAGRKWLRKFEREAKLEVLREVRDALEFWYRDEVSKDIDPLAAYNCAVGDCRNELLQLINRLKKQEGGSE